MGEAEDVVHHEDEGAAFIVGECAFGIAEGFKGGADFGAGFTVFLKLGGFAAGAGESVDQAGEGCGVAAELFVEHARAELAHGVEDME